MVFAVAITGCTAQAPPPTTVTVTVPRAEDTTTAAPPTTRREDSIVASGYAAVCQGNGFPDAAEYTGKGPHRIAVSVSSDLGGYVGLEADLNSEVTELPAAWKSSQNTELKLVACVRVTAVREVKTCDYQSIGSVSRPRSFSARLHERVLSVEVRATRTGERVAGPVTVTTGAVVCAGSSERPPSGSDLGPHQYGTLTTAQRDSLFRDLVTATV